MAPIAAMKKTTSAMRRARLLASRAQRRALERLGEQHLLGEDQVRAVVVGHLVVMPHRDRVERTCDLAVPAEDAARQVDLVDGRVALARADPVVGRVLRGHDADAVGRAGGRAQRAADALLEPRVLEAMKLVATPEARVDRRLLLGVVDRDRTLDHAGEGRLEALQRRAEGTVRAGGGAGPRSAHHLDDVGAGVIRHVTTTRIAVTRAFTVASGSRIFQPSAISWS